jgi:hypothetical protein
MLNEKNPDAFPAVTVTTDNAPLVLGVTGLGLNVAVVPCGSPLAARVTGDCKPPDEASLSVNVPLALRRSMSHRSLAVI